MGFAVCLPGLHSSSQELLQLLLRNMEIRCWKKTLSHLPSISAQTGIFALLNVQLSGCLHDECRIRRAGWGLVLQVFGPFYADITKGPGFLRESLIKN